MHLHIAYYTACNSIIISLYCVLAVLITVFKTPHGLSKIATLSHPRAAGIMHVRQDEGPVSETPIFTQAPFRK